MITLVYFIIVLFVAFLYSLNNLKNEAEYIGRISEYKIEIESLLKANRQLNNKIIYLENVLNNIEE